MRDSGAHCIQLSRHFVASTKLLPKRVQNLFAMLPQAAWLACRLWVLQCDPLRAHGAFQALGGKHKAAT
jgi:hypothetical protein